MNDLTGKRVAVIGAGICGLTAADKLRKRGATIDVFEKSRGLGGRISTRRTRSGLHFDHGAQYMTVRNSPFRDFVDDAASLGAVKVWEASTASGENLKAGCYIGVPTMNAFLKPMAQALSVHLDTRVDKITETGSGVTLKMVDGDTRGPYDTVVCTAPPPQTRDILQSVPEIISAIDHVTVHPCWALMVHFDPALGGDVDTWRAPSENVGWIARSSSKPDRPTEETWVLHASPHWSRSHLELEKSDAADRLLAEFWQVTGLTAQKPVYVAAHRWRFAQTDVPLGKPFARSSSRQIYAGGDWALGGRVEFAFDSGRAIAEAIVDDFCTA